MTDKEAINHIQYGIIEGNYPVPKKLGIEALNMALDALKFKAKAGVVIVQLRADRDRLEKDLDDIRAEIEQLRLHKAQFLTNDNKVCIDSQEVLEIIDKHRKGE